MIKSMDSSSLQLELKTALEYCINAERYVVGLKKTDSERNGRMNYTRALKTASLIIDWTKSNGRSSIAIENLGGINAGQVDLAITRILKAHRVRINSWDAYDSPINPYLNNEWLSNSLGEEGINLIRQDFREDFADPPKTIADVVLACEVIEHLDYSNALELLLRAHGTLKRDGLLIVSVPNPFWLLSRLSVLKGKDVWFDNRIKSHLRVKNYGHINIFTKERLIAILRDLGFHSVTATTANHWRYSLIDSPVKYAAQQMIDAATLLIPDSRFTLFAAGIKK